MDKETLLNRYNNEEERLLVAKILDKIKLAKTKNQIVNTDFLDMYKKRICQEVLDAEKEKNYKFYLPNENLEKSMLVIYPEKLKEIFEQEYFNYSTLVKLIRIKLPSQLNEKYTHKDYLSGIMKLGIRREKIGDILVFEDGADIVVSSEIADYIYGNIGQLTRFSKSKIELLDINQIRNIELKKEIKRIVVSSMRMDNIIAEIANCSRSSAEEIIKEQRVFVNYENEMRNSRLINENDIIVIRGKGKFEITSIEGETRKGKLSVIVNHYI